MARKQLGWAWALWVGLPGCGLFSGAAQPLAGGQRLLGQVVDESGGPLPAAAVSWQGRAVAPIGADGSFVAASATGELVQGQPGLLTISAPGYATIYRAIFQSPGMVSNLGQVPLRTKSAAQTVTLPAAGAAPVRVEARSHDAGAGLWLAAGQLVDAAGGLVTGAVDVELDYWHPGFDLGSAPALRLAARSDSVVGLDCFGMVGLDISQNGSKLAVAPGEALTLEVEQTPSFAGRWLKSRPNLYALGTDDGLWRLEGTLADGRVSFDANTRVATAKLGHMSYWNIDGADEPDNGGCVRGRAMNACQPSQPLVGETVQLWALSYEQVANYPAKTDGAGNYCMNMPLADWIINEFHGSGTPIVTNYFVTGASIDNTVMCDPLPPSCRICDPFYESVQGPLRYCNDCRLDIKDSSWVNGPLYSDTCTPPTPTVEVTPCQFCPGQGPSSGVCTAPDVPNTPVYGACTKIPDVYIKATNCQCASLGEVCKVADGACCPSPDGIQSYCSPSTLRCVRCTVHKEAFNDCGSDEPCCTLPGKPPLQCSDGVCLPASPGSSYH